MERVLTVPPDFGDVKGVFIMLEGLLFGHNLNVHCPSGVFSALNGLVKIPAMALPVFGNEGFCFCIRQIFNSLLRSEVEFAPHPLIFIVVEGKRVLPIEMHVPEGGGNPPV